MDAPTAPTIRPPLLVPFDGSRPAEAILPFVPLLAGGSGRVILLQVTPQAEAIHSPFGSQVFSAAELQENAAAAAAADLERAAENLRACAPGLAIERMVSIGDPADEIMEVARQRQVEMILLSSQGRSATGERGFSSLVGRIVGATPVPVMIAQATIDGVNPDPIGRLVVAHDGSERAARVLPLVRELALRLATPVHIVTVIEDDSRAMPTANATAGAPHRRVEALADELNRARQRLEATGATLLLQHVPASWQVLEGAAAAAILGACEPRDILVFTSHGQTGAHWLMGSVSDRLVRESTVPVILLRTPPSLEQGPDR